MNGYFYIESEKYTGFAQELKSPPLWKFIRLIFGDISLPKPEISDTAKLKIMISHIIQEVYDGIGQMGSVQKFINFAGSH